jgi:hypothetical protein
MIPDEVARRLIPGECLSELGCDPFRCRISCHVDPAANTEINREFRRIRLLGAILKADMRANSDVCNKIPYSTEQGIFAKETGNLYARTGNLNGVNCRVISG